MYADDLTVYAVVNNVNNRMKLQNELNNLLEWSKNGNLILILRNVVLLTLVKKIYILIIALIILLFILAFEKKILVYYLIQICLSGSIYFNK